MVRLLLMAAAAAVLCCSSPAFAQLDYVAEVNDMSTVPIGATSPLGIDSSSIGGTGIPLGSTEIKSAGVSPLATYSTGTIALPGSGTTCPTSGMSQPGIMGAADTYDGGGMAMGSAATATAGTATTMTSNTAASGSTTAMSAPNVAPTDPGTLPVSGMSTTYAMETVGVSGMCSPGSSGLSPSTPMSTTPTTPGGNPRTGIPLDSSEIANLGVSSWATLPTPFVSPFATTPGTTLPTVPTMPVVTTPLSTPTTTAPPSLAASITSINNNSRLQSSISGIPILVPGLAGR